MHTQLTPVQREAMDLLVEEAGEVLQVLGKIGRHGLTAVDESVTPNVAYDNRADLNREVRDLMAAITVCHAVGILDEALFDTIPQKLAQVAPLLHYVDLSQTLKKMGVA